MISVLLPSRGRPQSLAKSVGSLLGAATEPERVEVLVAADPDDETTRNLAVVLGDAESATGKGQVRLWVAPERYGYQALHQYYNGLATMAKGDWCLLWNDDATMLTRGWDTAIHAQDPAVLWLASNQGMGGNFFPAWPRAWSDHLGHISLSPNVDVWISEVGRRINRERQIPEIQVRHDRADVTGGHQDQTYAEGRALMGPYANHPVHDSPEGREQRFRDAIALRRLLE